MGSIVSVSTSSIVNREPLWGLIVSVSTSSVVDRGIKPLWGKPKTIKLLLLHQTQFMKE